MKRTLNKKDFFFRPKIGFIKGLVNNAIVVVVVVFFIFFLFFIIIQWLKREWEIWILTILERLGCVSQLSYRNIDNTIVESTYGTSDVANYKALIYHPKFIIQYFENTMMWYISFHIFVILMPCFIQYFYWL